MEKVRIDNTTNFSDKWQILQTLHDDATIIIWINLKILVITSSPHD